MIAFLKGELIHKSPVHLIVDVNGVGYQVFVPLSTFYGLPELHARVALHVYTHMSEGSIRLFGFLTAEEQRIFEALISITKVGPKLALTILSGISIKDLLAAVAGNDIARLSAIHGVGRKTAERLTLEMKDKLEDLFKEGIMAAASGGGAAAKESVVDDALSALINLGYKRAEAEKALKTVRDGADGVSLPLEQLLKECLKCLA